MTQPDNFALDRAIQRYKCGFTTEKGAIYDWLLARGTPGREQRINPEEAMRMFDIPRHAFSKAFDELVEDGAICRATPSSYSIPVMPPGEVLLVDEVTAVNYAERTEDRFRSQQVSFQQFRRQSGCSDEEWTDFKSWLVRTQDLKSFPHAVRTLKKSCREDGGEIAFDLLHEWQRSRAARHQPQQQETPQAPQAPATLTVSPWESFGGQLQHVPGQRAKTRALESLKRVLAGTPAQDVPAALTEVAAQGETAAKIVAQEFNYDV